VFFIHAYLLFSRPGYCHISYYVLFNLVLLKLHVSNKISLNKLLSTRYTVSVYSVYVSFSSANQAITEQILLYIPITTLSAIIAPRANIIYQHLISSISLPGCRIIALLGLPVLSYTVCYLFLCSHPGYCRKSNLYRYLSKTKLLPSRHNFNYIFIYSRCCHRSNIYRYPSQTKLLPSRHNFNYIFIYSRTKLVNLTAVQAIAIKVTVYRYQPLK
jgi:hypothetical protein